MTDQPVDRRVPKIEISVAVSEVVPFSKFKITGLHLHYLSAGLCTLNLNLEFEDTTGKRPEVRKQTVKFNIPEGSKNFKLLWNYPRGFVLRDQVTKVIYTK